MSRTEKENKVTEKSRILVTCAKGITPFLREEILRLGFPVLAETIAGIATEGTMDDTLRLNLFLRTGHRVLFLIREFTACDASALYHSLSEIPWEEYLDEDGYVCVTASVDNPSIRDSRYANVKCKDAVVDRIREKCGRRPDSGPDKDRVVVNLYWKGEICSVYFDTSGEPLCQRGYRNIPMTAPMQETLADAVIMASGWKGAGNFINPMCDSIIKAVNKASIGSAAVSRNRFKEEDFLDFEIPLPPLPIQGTIIEKWETARGEITAIRERIKTLSANIDKEFLSSIGLNPDIKQLNKKAFAVKWAQLSRWDVTFAQNLGKEFRSSLYHNVTIFDVIQPLRATTTRSNPNLHPKEKVNYIGLANVESSTGRLVEFSPVFGEKIESSCVVFDQEHILYAKLRPYLRKVICPSEYGLSNGVASSEFLTIKPRENILKDFLAHYLRSTEVEIQARQAIGARMPRISSESLLSFIIPLLPLNI